MKNSDFNHLPQWLPKKIEATGLTTEQVAQRTGVSRTVMYEYLRDDARPSEKTARSLAKVLGVKVEEVWAQYVPKKTGRPRGSDTTSELKVRNR